MQYFYPLLIYTVLVGTLLLLVLEMIPGLHGWRKPATAAWLTLTTFVWLLLPQNGTWLFSLWLPSNVLGGEILMSMTPVIWILGLVLGLILSGLSWIEAVESQPPVPLSGMLVLLALLVTWLALLGGSLLTTLAAWAVFDLVWGVSRLLTGGIGERATFGLALHGISSLILWTVSLLLERAGASVLWWLMWPTPAILALLLVSVLLRIGVYPFQIVLPRRFGALGPLAMISVMGPILGVGLLYRILMLPGMMRFPAWFMALGALSFLFLGLRAWAEQNSRALLWASYALLGAIVAGAGFTREANVVPLALAAWLSAWSLMSLGRGRDTQMIFWSWPGWVALLCLLGVPPSPLGELYRGALAGFSWGWRIVFVLGGGLTGAVFLREAIRRPALGCLFPAWPWQQVGLLAGTLLPLFGLVTVLGDKIILPFSWIGFFLWLAAILISTALVWKGRITANWLREGKPVLDFWDLSWLYRGLWQGQEHLVSVVRTVAEVVEGRGALLWSLWVLLIALLVVMNR